MMCDFCNRLTNDLIPLNDTQRYSGFEIAINRQGLLRVRYYDERDVFVSQDVININFCPICGREFKEK